MRNVITLSIITLLAALTVTGDAQTLADSRQSSYYRFIYELTQDQAKSIYRKGMSEVDASFFHTVHDSIPLDSTFNKPLPQGNYLVTWVANNQLQFEFRSYSNVHLNVHNNYADLALTVTNTFGKPIEGAMVRMDGKQVHFDQSTITYRWPNKNRKGWVEVSHQGYASYFYLDNTVGKGSVTRKILYSFPLKYITIPIRLVLALPFDIYKSIKHHHLYGLPYYVAKPFKDVVYSIKWGDPRGWILALSNQFDKSEKWKYGYAVFSRPKYRPGDTVRVKAYVANKNGKPYNGPLNIYLHSEKTKLLGEAIHTHKGSYHYELVLHDSLRLKLDKSYRITFGTRSWTSLSSGYFKYEDYELKGVKYSLRSERQQHYRGEQMTLYAKGEDMNGMIIPDGEIDIVVHSDYRNGVFCGPSVFLPDTLWTHSQALDVAGETVVHIPDSLFPAINTNYRVKAVFKNAENECIEKQLTLQFWNTRKELLIEKQLDSLFVAAKELNRMRVKQATVTGFDVNNNQIMQQALVLPHRVKIDPVVAKYVVTTDSLTSSFDMQTNQPGLSLSTSRSNKQVVIQSNNPSKVSFRYFIYKKNREVARGYTAHLDTTLSAYSDKNIFVALTYEWGGKTYAQNYEIPLREKQLNIEVEQPAVIYPGETKEIVVKVTDSDNRPVNQVDVTAWGLTKKFRYAPPSIPYFGKQYASRTMRNNYENKGDQLFGQSGQLALDYSLWKVRMQLDTIAYFQFSHPGTDRYVSTLPVESKLTQIAPFVFKKGLPQQVHLLWIDHRLVYSSVATTNDPYSFKCKEGYRKIRMRTADHDITLDSVWVDYQQKTIVAIDPESSLKASVTGMDNQFNAFEKSLLKKHFAPFVVKHEHYPVFINHYERYHQLKEEGYNRWTRQVIVGPLSETKIHYRSDKSSYFRFEPGYEYQVKDAKIKMKQYPALYDFTNRILTNASVLPNLKDEVWTRAAVERWYQKKRNTTIARIPYFRNPWHTQKGNGSVQLQYENLKSMDEDPAILRNVLLFKDDDPLFIRVYNGVARNYEDLAPGQYRLVFLLDEERYFEWDAVQVHPNGTNFIRVKEPEVLLAGQLGKKMARLIEKKASYRNYSNSETDEVANQVRQEYLDHQTPVNGPVITGVVTDGEGLPLPGVNVFVKGTTIGTITNIDGYYELTVPDEAAELVFSFIGFVSKDVPLGYSNQANVSLKEEELHLDEVVVMGYGTQKKQSLTGSVATVTSQALMGRVAGVEITGSAGSAGDKVMIRGVSAFSGAHQPLYIINGVPYEGDFSQFDQSSILNMTVLRDAAATALYGARAANGAVIIEIKEGTTIPFTKVDIPVGELPLILPAGNKGLRTNFSDEAYWQPNLLTNKNGEVRFTVTYPDDITAWKAYVMAAGRKGHTGAAQSMTKAFLPLSGNLLVPRFLTEGDSLTILGKTINYLPDSMQVHRQFGQPDSTVVTADGWVDRLAVDSLSVVVPQCDTLAFKYTVETGDFKDGEQREVPVFPVGSMEAKGFFTVLQSDTSLTIPIEAGARSTLRIESNPLEVLISENNYLRSYRYLCNEQAASKLKGLLMEQKICEALDRKFKYDKEVDKLLKRLLDGKNTDQLWGWWPGNTTTPWITSHVIEAFLMAMEAGYFVDLNRENLITYLVSAMDSQLSTSSQLGILETLQRMEAQVDYESLTDSLANDLHHFPDSATWMTIRQQAGLAYDLKPLLAQHEKTLFGSIYWGEPGYRLFNNAMMQTVLMYQLLKNDGAYDKWLPRIRTWFFEQRRGGHWGNTYYASRTMATLLPDLLALVKNEETNALSIQVGGETIDIEQFPYQLELDSAASIQLNKKGTQPIFVGLSRKYFNPDPLPRDSDFVIQTHWVKDGEQVQQLIAGEKYQLEVKIQVKRKSDYLMLEVPIPAGCSYASKQSRRWDEAHREYFKERVNIYFHSLQPGHYTKTIDVVPRFTGRLTINPARMEQMYFPIFYGRNAVKKVTVVE